MLTVLAGLPECERELIRVRTGEGRERAKRRGVRFGRRPKLTPQQRSDLLRRRAEGEETRRAGPALRCAPKHDFEVERPTEPLLTTALLSCHFLLSAGL